ncbi:unnamed protein product [Protopolystoma xenopodis]|uniref:Uncharacterized protein n=1 Tax=Protopolystoma xenopodis TaxID=117903 RepID=A0A3S5CJQ5_9PLAT|nr:unnamed protein product [Protopolystoma xenopodis]
MAEFWLPHTVCERTERSSRKSHCLTCHLPSLLTWVAEDGSSARHLRFTGSQSSPAEAIPPQRVEFHRLKRASVSPNGLYLLLEWHSGMEVDKSCYLLTINLCKCLFFTRSAE